MAQAGIHALAGAALRKVSRSGEGLLIGIILGNLAPDLDNLAVAIATVTGGSTEGLHRTFTHSFFTAVAVALVFYLAGWVWKKPKIGSLGLGLGIGIVMHILLDLLVWFDGVQVFWPLPIWVNLWQNVAPPEWFSTLMMPLEFLFMAVFLVLLVRWGRQADTDREYLSVVLIIVYVLLGLFVVFTVLAFALASVFMVPYGALYLIALAVVIGVTIRMRRTIGKIEMQQSAG